MTRAKYIEGLENRLGRMESLLKLSGILGDGEGDLGQLEKKLADKAGLSAARQHRRSSTGDVPIKSSPRPQSSDQNGTIDSTSDYTATNGQQSRRGSESPRGDTKKSEEVEALSDMMCSLVTNNYGETRFIGKIAAINERLTLMDYRLIIRLLNIFSQRHTMGKRENWRRVFPENDDREQRR